jgi:heme-degrading monooxygenase HmoA
MNNTKTSEFARRHSDRNDPNYFSLDSSPLRVDINNLLHKANQQEIDRACISSSTSSLARSVDPDAILDSIIGCNQDGYQSAEDLKPNPNPLRRVTTSFDESAPAVDSKAKTNSDSFRKRIKVRRQKDRTISNLL